MYPVNRWNTQCSAAELNATPCSCYGGAARRNAVLTSGDASTVRIDLGGYASGSGLFFPVFNGQASSRFLGAGGYSAFGLTYREFSVGANASDPTGGVWLAGYIDRVRALDPSLPPAVVTNIDLADDPHLIAADVTRAQPTPPGHVAPWALVPLSGNRTLAFLNLADPQVRLGACMHATLQAILLGALCARTRAPAFLQFEF